MSGEPLGYKTRINDNSENSRIIALEREVLSLRKLFEVGKQREERISDIQEQINLVALDLNKKYRTLKEVALAGLLGKPKIDEKSEKSELKHEYWAAIMPDDSEKPLNLLSPVLTRKERAEIMRISTSTLKKRIDEGMFEGAKEKKIGNALVMERLPFLRALLGDKRYTGFVINRFSVKIDENSKIEEKPENTNMRAAAVSPNMGPDPRKLKK